MDSEADDRPTSREDMITAILVAALADGLSHGEAGRLAGVSAKYVQRRLSQPAFVRQVSRARADRVAEISGRLASMSHHALDVLHDLMGAEEPARVRLAAASAVLRGIREFRPSELESRVAALEDVRSDLEALEDEA